MVESVSSPDSVTGVKNKACRVCHKRFSKAEHLRRHERCHTGSKPFACGECGRAFARQDALTRHEKLHRRNGHANHDPSTSSLPTPSASLDLKSSWYANASTSSDPIAAKSRSRDPYAESEVETHQDMRNDISELDFDLIWPDTENLFQSIVATDEFDHWKMLSGTLPFPLIAQDINGASLGSPVSFNERGSPVGAIPYGGGHRAVQDVTELVANSSSCITAAVKATSITSVFLDECLHMFFVRFVPTFPVLHRATFVFRDCTHPLLLNAIAIGSLYLGPSDSVARGETLWRLAHTAVATSWQSLITHIGPYDPCHGVQLVLAALLGQVYGALSKNRAIRTTSQILRPLGFFWARHCGMYDCKGYSSIDLPQPEASPEEKEVQWRTWAACEIQQRALLAHYVLDGLLAQMTGNESSARHVFNPLRLPSSEAAFDANTAEEWLAHMRLQGQEQSSFQDVFRLLFSQGGNSRPLDFPFSSFALRVILEGLQSLVSEGNEHGGAFGIPTRSEVRRALVRVHETISMCIQFSAAERLEMLLRWHTVCLDTMINSTTLSRNICDQWKVPQHVWGSCLSVDSPFDLLIWARTEDARRAVLHAVAIQDIVEQLPRGRAHVIHMPSSLFAAATIYMAFSLAGMATLNLPLTVIWQDSLVTRAEFNLDRDDIPRVSGSETRRFVEHGSGIPPVGCGGRNLLYELNSMQKLFRCLSSQWGIAHDMESVVAHWIQLCH
ncbi:Zinc finger C2H2 type domain-containing protein [Penicillium ucsense]|uniref:Zinc finger C2H2 type domain-containing protein n=1 Tax=Penicillium ucsense TaxID=2839758 RepID=A0A8J8W6L8_9EURO|nr:Zinc finger C2H2 type domain-containing protein [Penicillium ucsense]KAF7738465.1 Zinc finger C2H2 type domain-containing protein [Penicillium ucsense]